MKQRKWNTRALILISCFFMSPLFAESITEEDIKAFQKEFDTALHSALLNELDELLTTDFEFAMAGCHEGEFKTFTLTREAFFEELANKVVSLKHYSKKRISNKISILRNGTGAISDALVIEESTGEDASQTIDSQEVIAYRLGNGGIHVESMMVLVKKAHTEGNDAACASSQP